MSQRKKRKCNNHRMDMIESNMYGYTSRCDNCKKTYTYCSLTYEENFKKAIAIVFLISIVVGLLWVVIEKIIDYVPF